MFIKHEPVDAQADLWICLAVCSMAGPLGGMEFIHHLLLPGGWKPDSSKCSRAIPLTPFELALIRNRLLSLVALIALLGYVVLIS